MVICSFQTCSTKTILRTDKASNAMMITSASSCCHNHFVLQHVENYLDSFNEISCCVLFFPRFKFCSYIYTAALCFDVTWNVLFYNIHNSFKIDKRIHFCSTIFTVPRNKELGMQYEQLYYKILAP